MHPVRASASTDLIRNRSIPDSINPAKRKRVDAKPASDLVAAQRDPSGRSSDYLVREGRGNAARGRHRMSHDPTASQGDDLQGDDLRVKA
jgi:hypothetical protein